MRGWDRKNWKSWRCLEKSCLVINNGDECELTPSFCHWHWCSPLSFVGCTLTNQLWATNQSLSPSLLTPHLLHCKIINFKSQAVCNPDMNETVGFTVFAQSFHHIHLFTDVSVCRNQILVSLLQLKHSCNHWLPCEMGSTVILTFL